jgi:signal transduction histidine kinase
VGDHDVSTPKEEAILAIVNAKADLDQALVELEKLPALDPGKAIFAAHALNNFLMVSRATLELLTLSLADHPDAQVHSWLKGLSQVTNLMTHTVNQVLTASADRDLRFLFGKVDLVSLIRRGCEFYRRLAEPKQIQITYEPSVASPYVWTDGVAVGAVLDNLLSNAVKFSDPGKSIHVTVQDQAGHLVCGVQDEGPGLSAEDQAKLFQRGVRLGAVPTGGEPSTGFGLAVAKELVEKLGGTIKCESVLGQGARFSFSLPVYEEHQHPVEKRPPGRASA